MKLTVVYIYTILSLFVIMHEAFKWCSIFNRFRHDQNRAYIGLAKDSRGFEATQETIGRNRHNSLNMISGSSTHSNDGARPGGKDFVWKEEKRYLELKDVKLATRELNTNVPETNNKFPYTVIKIDKLPQVVQLRFHEISHLPFTMIVRKSYIELYDLLKAAMSSGIISTHLVTGVPGIGKSLFMLYFMYRYSRDPKGSRSFVLQFTPGKYSKFYFNEDGSLQKIDEKYESPGLDDILLVDFKAQEEPGKCGGRTIIFSSPNPKRYKQTVKGGTKFYLPTWTELEMHCAAKYNSITDWFERYQVFGGVPRNVFHKGDPFNELETALEQNGSFFAKHYAESICRFMGPNPDEDYILVHINPKTNGTDEFGEPKYQYDEAVYRFASDAIEVRILEENKDWAFSSISNYLKNDQNIYYDQGTADYLFKQLLLWVNPIAGSTLTNVVCLETPQVPHKVKKV